MSTAVYVSLIAIALDWWIAVVRRDLDAMKNIIKTPGRHETVVTHVIRSCNTKLVYTGNSGIWVM